MINKKIFFSFLLLTAGFLSAAAQKSPQDMDRFIDALMKKMTVEEKDRATEPPRRRRDHYRTSQKQ